MKPKFKSTCSLLCFGFILAVTVLTREGRADLYDLPKVTAVAHKKYYLRDEVTLQISFLASDPFEKYLTGGASYTHMYGSLLGWEIFNANYAYAFDSGLKNDLVVNQGVALSRFDYLQYYATTNLVVSPIYTKNLIFNSSTVYSEISFAVGAGLCNFYYGGFQPMFDGGIILRYFLGPSTSLKFDFRDNIFPGGYTNNNLTVMAGYAFTWGASSGKPGD